MNPAQSFRRLIIDLDLAGGPVGVAVETYVDGQKVRLSVLPKPGPFDTVVDAFAMAVDFADAEHGSQPSLF